MNTLRRDDRHTGVSAPTVFFAIAAVITGMSLQLNIFESDDAVPQYRDNLALI